MKDAGYLLPSPDRRRPSGLGCFLVFYPDEPEYRLALVGSIAYLATWVAWERDKLAGGRDAADMWKVALEETLSNMTCLDSIALALAGIQSAIENISLSADIEVDNSDIVAAINALAAAGEDAVIINNCNCNCGCGGGGGAGVVVPPDLVDDMPVDVLPPDPPQPPVDSEPPGSEYEALRCGIANYYYYVLRKIALDMAEGAFTPSNIVSKFETYFPGGVWTWAGGVYQAALAVLNLVSVILVGGTTVSVMAAQLDAKANEIKCALLAGGGAAAVRAIIDTMSLPASARYVLKVIVGYIPTNDLGTVSMLDYLQSVFDTVLSGFMGNCPDCGQGDDDIFPVEPVGYQWVQVEHPTVTESGNLTQSVVGLSWVLSATAVTAYFRSAWAAIDFVGVLGVLIRIESAYPSIIQGGATADWFANLTPVAAGETFVFMNNGAPPIDWGGLAPVLSNKAGSRFMPPIALPNVGVYRLDFWFLRVDDE